MLMLYILLMYSWFLNVVKMYKKASIEHTPSLFFTYKILRINVLYQSPTLLFTHPMYKKTREQAFTPALLLML